MVMLFAMTEYCSSQDVNRSGNVDNYSDGKVDSYKYHFYYLSIVILNTKITGSHDMVTIFLVDHVTLLLMMVGVIQVYSSVEHMLHRLSGKIASLLD